MKLTDEQLAELRRSPCSPYPNRIAHARKLARLTQSHLAVVTGIPQSQISAMERGVVKAPGTHKVLALARAIGCSVEDFYPDTTSTETAPVSASAAA